MSAEELWTNLERHIREIGWSVMGVGAGEDETTFAYTVGLLGSYGHPELIMAGLSHDTMHTILNDAGRRIRDGEVFRSGDTDDGLLAGYDARFVAVLPEASASHLTFSATVAGLDVVPALQIVWPDKDGRMPWEEGYAFGPSVQPVWG